MKLEKVITLLEEPQNLQKLFKNSSTLPIIGSNGKYNILYKTVCSGNGKVYVGVHSSDTVMDSYLGCGLSTYNTVITEDELRWSHFARAFKKYGVSSFSRINLLFFHTAEECFEAESRIVNIDFINSNRTMNVSLGGNKPPTSRGRENGNYGKYWSEEKKLKLSKYFKKNRHSVGEKNPMATKCTLINVVTGEVLLFNTIKETSIFLKKKSPTLSTTFMEKGEGFITYVKGEDKYYIVFRHRYYSNLSEHEVQSFISRSIEKSRFKERIKCLKLKK